MEKGKAKRPSPSLVLSMVTLFVALTSTAGALPGKNLVKKGDIAKGAVTARALARGAVKTRALRNRAVTSDKLANKAVVQRTLAPFSVGAFALGNSTIVSSPIADVDPTANDFQWNSSPAVSAVCPSGSVLLGGGVDIATSATHKAFIQSSYSSAPDRWTGAISTDTGGASPGHVYAVCLL